jgi:hypothetical protein
MSSTIAPERWLQLTPHAVVFREPSIEAPAITRFWSLPWVCGE